MIIAGVDIGTNTILMTIADYTKDNFKVIGEKYAVARLGQGVDKSGYINQDAIERTKSILNEFAEYANSLSVERKYIVATSAMRDAKNNIEVKQKLEKSIDGEIHIISGDEEAHLSYIGTVNNDKKSLVIDIGGGSTELILGQAGEILHRKSFNFGAVRLTERFINSQPPSYNEIQNVKDFLQEELNSFKIDNTDINYYGVAGTSTTVALTALGLKDYEVAKADGFILKQSKLNDIVEMYNSSDVDTIINKFGVNPKRADLISAGALILQSIFNHLKIKNCTISSKGLRYGAIYKLISEIN